MRKSLVGLAVLATLSSTPVFAGPQQTPPASGQDRVAALEARVQALEAELQQIRAELAGTGVTAANEGEGNDAPVATEAGFDPDAFEALAAVPQDSAPASATTPAPATSGAGGGSGANAFNPAIMLILNGSVSNHGGLSLGESELAFAANIDDKFSGQLTLAVESEDGEDEIGIEEAFIDTMSLPGGLAIRAGRFFSNIGYLNSHHAHTDRFFDRPLAYQAFLGGQYGDDGVQLRWVAPTSTFLELGGELFRGDAFPAAGGGHGGVGTRTLFAHVGGDAGRDNEWLAGASVLKARSEGDEDGFVGDTTVYVFDGTWKWAPQGNFKDGGLTLRGEYLIDDRDGRYGATGWNAHRNGGYVEGVYRLSRTWDVGYRYDRLWLPADGVDPTRHSAEITWRNSEFSLLRLQLSRDDASGDVSGNTVTLQYQTSLGAHGAHKF
jgi:hypothetical protein